MKTLDDYLFPVYCDVKRNYALFYVVDSFCAKDDPDVKRIWTRLLMCSLAALMIWDGDF